MGGLKMEVKLEDLMKAKQGLATADVTPDNLPSAEVMTAQVEKVVNDLTPEERSKVDKIKDELDLTDSTAILRFGAPAQQKIAEFSDSVLSQVRTKDSGPVGELLSSLVTQVREFEPEGNSSFLKKIPLVGSLVKKGEDIKQGYEKLSTQVERIQGNLEQAKLKMMKDVALFDKLYAENLSYFKQLQLYIQAGEEKLTEICKAPRNGRPVINPYLKRKDIRRFLVKNYIGYYLVDEDTGTIVVLRIVYGKRNQDKILKTI
jgi:uncharacterized protein YaaN involved in tellurite resistance